MSEILTSIASIPSVDTGELSIERSRTASEIGAAIAHQLNGPLTALLLYVTDLHDSRHQFPVNDGHGQPLRQIAEHALREAEYACALIQRISDACEAAPPDQASVAHGRDVISWWSRTTSPTTNSRAARDAAAVDTRVIDANSSYHVLTRRERDVLRLVAQGLTNKQGALQLNIGPRTFESHRARIMRKFKARNAADLVRMALQTEMPVDGQQTRPDSVP
jgi:DNA-binding CsgD family transcriptional regulator